MTVIQTIEATATLLWCYAGVSLLAWAGHLRRSPKQEHIPHVTDLLANMVPPMVCLLVVVITGAMLGFPTVVVLIAILFPAGLAFAFHMSLNDIRPETTLSAELTRISAAVVLGGCIIAVRQAG